MSIKAVEMENQEKRVEDKSKDCERLMGSIPTEFVRDELK